MRECKGGAQNKNKAPSARLPFSVSCCHVVKFEQDFFLFGASLLHHSLTLLLQVLIKKEQSRPLDLFKSIVDFFLRNNPLN